ncbi:unnamed protein product [Rhodiola kirilowii]
MALYLHATVAAICMSLSLVFVASQAAVPGELYWNSLLPNTSMPRAVSNILRPGTGGGILPNMRGSKDHAPNSEDGGEAVYDQRLMFYARDHDTLKAKENGPVVYDQRLMFYARDQHTLDTEKNGVVHDQRLIFYGRKQYQHPLSSDKDKVLINPPTAPWFLEKDLYPGKEMEMEIPRPGNHGYTFVPRQAADSIPFSSDKFPVVLEQLSIKPGSPKAEMMKITLKECELPAEKDEIRTCVTSLESMIDFSIQQLGKNIQAFSTEAEKDTKLQKFTMQKGIKLIGQDKIVACHTLNYPYAVFYCHVVKSARAYGVPFVGISGTNVMSVGVCHTNTTSWHTEHESFQILKVKPGGKPVCHFLPDYNILWTRK